MRQFDPYHFTYEYIEPIESDWFVVEDTLLREPNLWTPKSKPVGIVKVDWSHPLTDGLIAYWAMLERGESRVFDLVSHEEGTVIGTAAWEPDGLLFNGTSDYVHAFNYLPGFSNNTDFTIIISFTSTDIASPQGLVAGRNIGSAGWTFSVVGSKLAFYTSPDWWSSNTTLSSDTEYIAAITHDTSADELRFYINGRPDGTSTPGTFFDVGYLSIGSWDAADTLAYLLEGKTRFVQMFNRKLTDGEIAALYRDPYQFLIPA